jgi:tetratricopeptide (TPR) repeat protein
MKYVILGISIAAAVGFAACSSERDAPPAPPTAMTRVADPSDAIGEDLMLALGQAKNHHRKAKVYMADGNLSAAIAAVRQVLSLQFPRGAPEADDVRNDARALLAKLLMNQGQIDEAARTVDEGLAQSQRESFFVANLYTVQGEIHEARAAAFDAQGESGKPSATAERRAAIASYDRSIRINEQLQKKLQGDQ